MADEVVTQPDPEPEGAIEVDLAGSKQKMVPVGAVIAERKRASEKAKADAEKEYEPIKAKAAQADQLAAEAQQLALDRDEGDTQFDEEGGEGDTISVERERDLMLSASARQTVEEIDRALERIKNRKYGLCVPAGRRISVERLEALPYAETCVDCKARAERRR